jgi:hypothetical protein
LPTGTRIDAEANIVFDLNAPIDTPAIFNTLDAGPPESIVAPLPLSQTTSTFTVSWSGVDDDGGSGIASFDIFVSDNSGPFTLFLDDTTDLSASFTGMTGHTYRFYSIATDNVGQVEATPAQPDAQTTVDEPGDTIAPTSAVAALPNLTTTPDFTITWSGADNPSGSGIASFDILVSDDGGPFTLFRDNTTQTSAVFNGIDGHTYRFQSVATDNAGNIEAAPSEPDAQTTVQLSVQPQFAGSSMNGPTVAVPGQLRSYFVTFTDTAAAGPHTATIQWDDGVTETAFVRETTAGGTTTGVISFWHTYTSVGDYLPVLSVHSQNNQTNIGGFVTVQAVTFQPDPHDANKTALVVGAVVDPANQSVANLMLFEPHAGQTRVNFNGADMGAFSFDGSIVAYGQAGDDLIQVSPLLSVSSLLFGGGGNDILVGGAANDILVGGSGNDILYGSGGNDLLFAGLGSDYLQGSDFSGLIAGADSDLLVADYSAIDYDVDLLIAVYQRWTNPDPYAERVQDLRSAPAPLAFMDDSTLFNDFAGDLLFGGSDLDWLLPRIGHDFAGDMQPGEEVTQ